MPDFVHLHVHSDYSLLDGACKHDGLLEHAKRYGMGAVAVTDHGNLFGAMEFYQKAVKAGVKPILGCEMYTLPSADENAHADPKQRSGQGDYNHLLLLCETYEGWKNLSKLVSISYRDGFYYKPRVSRAILRKYAKGLICTSACLKGEVAQAIVADRNEQAKASLLELRDIFEAPYKGSAEAEKPHFFIELQSNGVAEQRKANAGLIEYAKSLSVPLVGTGDVHYLDAGDRKVQDALICINTGKVMSDPNRMKIDAELHFRSKEEMASAFSSWNLPEEALANTALIAERCNVDLKKNQFGKTYLPRFSPPAERTATAADAVRARGISAAVPEPEEGSTGAKTPPETRAFFRNLVEEGLEKRYGKPLSDRVLDRYREELTVIQGMGFMSYLLIVWDFINWAKRNGIPVGPGRGSAAGSIICYAIGITDIDPLAYDLLFERFLNKERVSMPDIDVDFCQERRGEVIEYVRQKYGDDCVGQIITFGTMAAKSAIRDVGRVLGIPLPEVDKVAKLIPGDLQVKHKKLKDAFAEVPDLAEQKKDPRFAELFEIAEKLEGFVRNCSTHAAGVVIGDCPLQERVPLYVDPKSPVGPDGQKEIITQFPMTLLENECGLIKMDFLGLKTLTVIQWALEHVKKTTGKPLDLSADVDPVRTDMKDPTTPTAKKVYELLCAGATRGVFQFESSGYRDLLTKLRPDGFEDIIALGAMYRPGPLGAGMVDAYVRRKHKQEEVTYLHPLLERVLGTTYGCMLYQEQIMRITNVLAGFTLSQADSLRKAMGKKKPEEMAKYKGKFVEGAGKNGCAPEVAEKIWEQMEFFAGYGFNRSHSAAYGLVTFQTAWLKANYPVEFMAALLTSEVSSIEKVTEYVEEAERMGIEVLPPDVNESEQQFSVVKGKDGRKAIRYGLIAIRGLGERTIHAIQEARARLGGSGAGPETKGRFRSIFDLCAEVDKGAMNKASLEAMLKAGALRTLGARRSQIAAVLERAMAEGARAQADKKSGQKSIFDMFGGAGAAAAPAPKLPDVPEWTEQEILAGEKETLGFYLTSHPLKKHRGVIARYSTATTKTLRGGAEVLLGGMVAQVRSRPDKKGNMMAFLTIEDLEGSCDAVVFSRVYEVAKAHLGPEAIVFVKGKVDTSREQPSLIVDEIVPIAEADQKFAVEVRVLLPRDKVEDEPLARLAKALESARGRCPVVVEFETRERVRVRVRAAGELNVEPGEKVERAVESVLGPGCVRITGGQGRDGAAEAAAAAAEMGMDDAEADFSRVLEEAHVS